MLACYHFFASVSSKIHQPRTEMVTLRDAAPLMPHFWKNLFVHKECPWTAQGPLAFSTDCIFLKTKYCILEMKTACKEDSASCKESGFCLLQYCISQMEAASLKEAVLFQNQQCFEETLHMQMQREYGYGIFSRHTTLFCTGRGIPFRGKQMLQNYFTALTIRWAWDILQFSFGRKFAQY